MLKSISNPSQMFVEAHNNFWMGTFDVITLDIETTIVDRSPMPSDGAKIVLAGARKNDEPVWFFDDGCSLMRWIDNQIKNNPGHKLVLAGHNIKFDLIHLRAENEAMFEAIFGTHQLIGIWDTMIWEYLNSGQVLKNSSLEEACEFHGLDFEKDEKISKVFQNGYGADHIPTNLLEEYLKKDVEVTSLLVGHQLDKSDTKALCSHMFVQGWALLGYARMESRGLGVDRAALAKDSEVLGNNIQRREKLIEGLVDALFGEKGIPCTNKTFSTVFFGEPGVKRHVSKPVGTYKNGKTKYKKTEVLLKPASHLHPHSIFAPGTQMHNEVLGWKMDEDTLQSIARLEGNSLYGKLATLILAARKDEKLASTYVEPMLAASERDGRVHHSINQCVTDTGRTSSSSPNAQNMPDPIRKRVIAGPGHVIYSADFSQLEMVVAAQLSGDRVMISDLETSDAHYETGLTAGLWKNKSGMTKDKRRLIKGVNFGTIYGGSAKTLAQQTGVDEGIVKSIQNAFFERYPDYYQWRVDMLKTVSETPGMGKPTFNEDGQALYRRPYLSVTGRTYMFQEKPKPWAKNDIGPVPSQVYNYPIQGTATGDIVPLFIALVCGYRWTPGVHPINAVHDSVVFEVRKDLVLYLENLLNYSCEDLTQLIGRIYNWPFSAELKLDHEQGPTWT